MSDRNTQKRVNMSINEHAEQAVKRLRNGTINEVNRAGVEATLALAYEQRTANLIAYQSNVERSYAKKAKVPRSEQASALNRQIIERLSLS